MDSKSMSMKATRDRAMKRVRERNSKGLLGKDGTISPGMLRERLVQVLNITHDSK